MRPGSFISAVVGLLCIVPLPSPAECDITVSTDTLITATDLSCDGRSLLVDGAVLTIEGTHGFTALSLTNGAVLTHPPATETTVYSLSLTVTHTLDVSADSSISAVGRGYLPGYTSGNTTDGGTTEAAGGSYGGVGAPLWGIPCTAYGNFLDPDEPGSGSGRYNVGAAGGGLIRIAAETLILNGSIRADGGDHPATRGGGGSGGGIRLDIGTLKGTGTIVANGGMRGSDAGSGGGGGGGRIAVYSDSVEQFDLTNNIACVGSGGNQGSAGTIYLKHGANNGQLIIDSRNLTPNLATPLLVPDGTCYAGDILLRGNGLIVELAAPAIIPANVTLQGGALLTHPAATTNREYRLELAVTGTLSIDAASAIETKARGYLPGYTLGNTKEGGTTEAAGGSYGGLGAPLWGTPCAVYGDLLNPNAPGSGSGRYRVGGPGGGLIRLTAAEIKVDGRISADGGDHPDTRGGGGSGGGIRIDTGTLGGSGTITANGGRRGSDSNSGGGGGGGRIAVYCDHLDGFDLVSRLSCAGTGGNAGAPGTIYTTNRTAHLAVSHIEPSGIVSNAISAVEVTFLSAPQPGSFDSSDLSFRGPAGVTTVSAIEQVDIFTYRAALSQTIAASGDYTLEIGPDILTVPGQPMASVHTHTFSIDLPFPAMPAIEEFLSLPATNMITNLLVTVQGTRDNNSSIWTNGIEAIANGSTPWTLALTLHEGENLLNVTARNLAGRTSPTNSLLFLLDSAAPVVRETNPSSGTETNHAPDSITVRFLEETSGIDIEASPRSVTRNGIPVPGSWCVQFNAVVFTPSCGLLDGLYEVGLTLIDRCGLCSAPALSTFSIESAPVTVNTVTPHRRRGTVFMFDRPGAHAAVPSADSDNDGLQDSWEHANMGSLDWCSLDDPDGDGLSNGEEVTAGCDPLSADSDLDGITDGADLNPVLNADLDMDGMADDWEIFWFGSLLEGGSDDHDSDGVLNREEYMGNTNPLLANLPDAAYALNLVVYQPLN